MQPRTIVHFEIPANNVEKLKGFYEKLFGWKISKGQGDMEYWMIETAPQGQGVNGGMMKKQMPEQGPVNYVLVESVDDFAKKATMLGGKVILPKQPIPDMGAFAVIQDPEGNTLGLFETSRAAA